MNPSHHPNDETLARFAAATLDEGARLVIGVHLVFCARCHETVKTLEAVGGALLDSLDPTLMTTDAFASVLQRLDLPSQLGVARAAAPRELVPGLALPEILRTREIGAWRTLAPGLKLSRVKTHDPDGLNVFFLRAAPGMSLMEHGHEGDEYICVLKGVFVDQGGRRGPGDMALADANVMHTPRVEMDGECICLVALEGKLRLKSLIGRVLQPVFGI